MRLPILKAALATALIGAAGLGHAGDISDNVIRIGFITDMSGVYSSGDGKGGAEAIKMAIADAGGQIDGKKIELLTADHQNKADIGAATARRWFDKQHIDVLIGGTNSAVNLAMARIAAQNHKPMFSIGSGSSRLTNENCTPYTIHYAYNTVALARGTASYMASHGAENWYFLTTDYAFGHSLQKDAAEVVKEAGGKVVGSVKVPLGSSDFSSYILQAQGSGAQVLGLANAGGDFVNAVKAAEEFGVNRTMKIAGLLVMIRDIHALGLNNAKGLFLTSAWYWDQDAASREWGERFYKTQRAMPTFIQAGDYSAVAFYLRGVKATGTDNGDAMMKWIKSNKVEDFFSHGGHVREDGLMVHDMYLMQVKTPAESKRSWDYYKLVKMLPGDQIYTPLAQSTCKFIKK